MMVQPRADKHYSYFYDEELPNYSLGGGNPMRPHRARLVKNLLDGYGMLQYVRLHRPVPRSFEQITQFHADDYIDFLRTVTPNNVEEHLQQLRRFNMGQMGESDCPVFDGVYEYCQMYSGGSVNGATQLTSGDADIVFNWSGGMHHAKRAEASGFCYVNDIVLAILELLKVFPRVLYVDIDIHHGDGVEEAFYLTDRVMTVSFHKYGEFFPGTGALQDSGYGKGKNYCVNVPLKDGMDDESYSSLFEPIMAKVLEVFQPSAIVMCCGADSLSGDRLGSFNLSIEGHSNCIEFLSRFNVPMLLLGGGGYTLRNVSRCWAYETGRIMGVDLPDELPETALHHYNYYFDTGCLRINVSNMKNMNTREDLDHIRQSILKNLSNLPPAPSAGMAYVPAKHEAPELAEEELEERGGGQQHREARRVRPGDESDEEAANPRQRARREASQQPSSPSPGAKASPSPGRKGSASCQGTPTRDAPSPTTKRSPTRASPVRATAVATVATSEALRTKRDGAAKANGCATPKQGPTANGSAQKPAVATNGSAPMDVDDDADLHARGGTAANGNASSSGGTSADVRSRSGTPLGSISNGSNGAAAPPTAAAARTAGTSQSKDNGSNGAAAPAAAAAAHTAGTLHSKERAYIAAALKAMAHSRMQRRAAAAAGPPGPPITPAGMKALTEVVVPVLDAEGRQAVFGLCRQLRDAVLALPLDVHLTVPLPCGVDDEAVEAARAALRRAGLEAKRRLSTEHGKQVAVHLAFAAGLDVHTHLAALTQLLAPGKAYPDIRLVQLEGLYDSGCLLPAPLVAAFPRLDHLCWAAGSVQSRGEQARHEALTTLTVSPRTRVAGGWDQLHQLQELPGLRVLQMPAASTSWPSWDADVAGIQGQLLGLAVDQIPSKPGPHPAYRFTNLARFSRLRSIAVTEDDIADWGMDALMGMSSLQDVETHKGLALERDFSRPQQCRWSSLTVCELWPQALARLPLSAVSRLQLGKPRMPFTVSLLSRPRNSVATPNDVTLAINNLRLLRSCTTSDTCKVVFEPEHDADLLARLLAALRPSSTHVVLQVNELRPNLLTTLLPHFPRLRTLQMVPGPAVGMMAVQDAQLSQLLGCVPCHVTHFTLEQPLSVQQLQLLLGGGVRSRELRIQVALNTELATDVDVGSVREAAEKLGALVEEEGSMRGKVLLQAHQLDSFVQALRRAQQ